MGHIYATRDNAAKYEPKKDDTLRSIAAQYAGKEGVPDDLDWAEIAKFNWGTSESKDVVRALCERIGCSSPGAVQDDGADASELPLDPAFGPKKAGVLLIPKLWKQEDLELNKKHTITVKRRVKASVIGITSLDKWFIPAKENCIVKYETSGEERCANAVAFEVYASNYCELDKWNDGLPEFKALERVPVYQEDTSPGNVTIDKWMGLTNCDKGALSGKDHPINVAFSPYTAMLRYARKGAHTDARIDLMPFWVSFQDGSPVKETCKIEWKLQKAEVKVGLLQVWQGDGTAVFAKGLDEDDLKANGYEWDGKDSTGAAIKEENGPFRLQLEAHTDIDTEDGLAIAAMHTEVRMYVHKDTHPLDMKDYFAGTDKSSLDFSIADDYPKPEPERSVGSLWTKYRLAKAGFHPGPVSDEVFKDDAGNDVFETALHEFQRSVPKAGGSAGSYERMPVGDDDDTTKDALEGMDPLRFRPRFGKPAELPGDVDFSWRPGNWEKEDDPDFLDRLRDPTKRMIVWVDDRNWYTDGTYWDKAYWDTVTVVTPYNLGKIHNDPAALGGADKKIGRGSYEDRDDRVGYDARDIARPWIPLQVDVRLLSKNEDLYSAVAMPTEKDDAEKMRRAIGPLRVDWTFDEIEKTSAVVGVTENTVAVTQELPNLDIETEVLLSNLYHPATVHGDFARPEGTRTRMALRWTLDNLKAKKKRQDVDRESVYYNAPKTRAGIRPDDGTDYYKEGLGFDKQSLAPWSAKADSDRESICTAIHDSVGQGDENVFDKCVGRAGVYFHPSRIAGDGYQVRAQLRFDSKGPYVFPNSAALKARYAKLPQAHSVQFRLWRKTSIRAFVPWVPNEDWTSVNDSCYDRLPKTGPDQWRAQYTACHVSIENELGASPTELITTIDKVFNDTTYKDLVVDALDAGDECRKLANQGWIELSPQYCSPWWNRADFGVPNPAVAQEFYAGLGELSRLLGNRHVFLAIRMSLEMVKAVEKLTGRMRGHVMVQYQTTPACHFRQYVCSGCPRTPTYVQNTDGTPMDGQLCPDRCGGTLSASLNLGVYQCNGITQHFQGMSERNSTGGGHSGRACSVAGCTGVLSAMNIYGSTYQCDTTGAMFNTREEFRAQYDKSLCPENCGGNLVLVTAIPVANRVLPKESKYDSKSARGNKFMEGTSSPSCGFPVGVFWNFIGDAVLWPHELGHNRHYEHAADAMQNESNLARPWHDSAVNAFITHADEKDRNKGWDRTCLMSYISQVKDQNGNSSYNDKRDMACFCYKCVLKNRGWKLDSLPMPAGDLQDVAGT